MVVIFVCFRLTFADLSLSVILDRRMMESLSWLPTWTRLERLKWPRVLPGLVVQLTNAHEHLQHATRWKTI